jgi:hypothetical protein
MINTGISTMASPLSAFLAQCCQDQPSITSFIPDNAPGHVLPVIFLCSSDRVRRRMGNARWEPSVRDASPEAQRRASVSPRIKNNNNNNTTPPTPPQRSSSIIRSNTTNSTTNNTNTPNNIAPRAPQRSLSIDSPDVSITSTDVSITSPDAPEEQQQQQQQQPKHPAPKAPQRTISFSPKRRSAPYPTTPIMSLKGSVRSATTNPSSKRGMPQIPLVDI